MCTRICAFRFFDADGDADLLAGKYSDGSIVKKHFGNFTGISGPENIREIIEGYLAE